METSAPPVAFEFKNHRLCTRCGTMAKPVIAQRAWRMFAMFAIMAVIDLFGSLVSASAGTPHDAIVAPLVTSALLFGAILHGRVCPECQSRSIVPLDTPVARRQFAASTGVS